MLCQCIGRTQQTAYEKAHGYQTAAARSVFFNIRSQKACGSTQEQNRQRKGPGNLLQRKTHSLHNRLSQYAPCVYAANADVNADGCQHDQPSVFVCCIMNTSLYKYYLVTRVFLLLLIKKKRLGDFAQTVGAYIHLPPRGQFHSSVRKQTALGYDSIIHKFLQLSTYSVLLIF